MAPAQIRQIVHQIAQVQIPPLPRHLPKIPLMEFQKIRIPRHHQENMEM